MNELEKKIEQLYKNFFDEMHIDKETGVVKDRNRKVGTYPYVGESYGKSTKVLIVGLDIGEDEIEGKIQSFVDRRSSLTDLTDMTHHMGGTYFTALYFLKDILGYNDFYNKVKTETIFKTIIKRHIKELPDENPVDYIGQTNFYKYVTVGRKNRRGDFDRIYIDKDKEIKLFLSELDIYDPDIIFFQSTDFHTILSNNNLLNLIKGDSRKVFVASHPSRSLPRLKYPESYFRDYCKQV
jgi:hypothetical protein